MTDFMKDELDYLFLSLEGKSFDSYEYGEFQGFLHALRCAKIITHEERRFLHEAAIAFRKG